MLYKERLYQCLHGYSHADAEVAPDPTSGWASPRSDAPLEPLSSEHMSALSDVDSMDGDSPVCRREDLSEDSKGVSSRDLGLLARLDVLKRGGQIPQ